LQKTVAVCGAFDPYPHAGHLEHIRKARELGDKLIVILNPDVDVIRKRGVCFTPMGQRYLMLKYNRYVDEIVISIDNDGTVAKTLLMIRPDIFAKGGDRIPDNFNHLEKEICEQIGCEVVFNVGDQLDSATEILRRIQSYKGDITHNAITK
jgi:cytidyltransferase-like protein